MIALLAVVMVVASIGFAASMLSADYKGTISMNSDVMAVSHDVSGESNAVQPRGGKAGAELGTANVDYNFVNNWAYPDRLEASWTFDDGVVVDGLTLTVVATDKEGGNAPHNFPAVIIGNEGNKYMEFRTGWNRIQKHTMTLSAPGYNDVVTIIYA